jgi:glycosyltransferase involved in cell wall biosynthesis
LGQQLRIGLYSPFFGSTYGGGEKYFGVTAEALHAAFPGAGVEIMSPVPVDVASYERMLGLDLAGIHFRTANRKPGKVKRILAKASRLRMLRDVVVSAQVMRATRDYDLFLSMVYVLPAATRARRSVILCQFPYELRWSGAERRLPGLAGRLYARTRVAVRQSLLGAEVDDFELVIAQSEYVRGWIRRIWGRDAIVVYPPIDLPEHEPEWEAKGSVILSVGRFFASGHSKRHHVMVQAFRDLYDAGHAGWELHLVGSLHRDYASDVAYFAQVCKLAQGYPIQIHVDATAETLLGLYRRASIYWHAAGYGADGELHPAQLEHFGMTTAEAMGHGAVPVVIALGGQVEVVQNGVSGYLWRDLDELKARTVELMKDPALRRQLGQNAWSTITRFSRTEFKKRMVAAVSPLVSELEGETAKTVSGRMRTGGD